MGKVEAAIARMAGRRVYIDTNIFIFFLERHETYFQVVAPIVQACAARSILGTTGELVIAEVMVHPYRGGNTTVISKFKDFFRRKNFLTVVGHETPIFDEAAMIAGQKRMKLIDAIHYRTALQAGCDYLLTHDTDFNAVGADGGLEVIQLCEMLEG